MRNVALALCGAALLFVGAILGRHYRPAPSLDPEQDTPAPSLDPELDTLIAVAKRIYTARDIARECSVWKDEHSKPEDFLKYSCQIWIQGQKTKLLVEGRTTGGPLKYLVVVTGIPLLSTRMTARFGKPGDYGFSSSQTKFWPIERECWIGTVSLDKHEEDMFYVCGDDGPK